MLKRSFVATILIFSFIFSVTMSGCSYINRAKNALYNKYGVIVVGGGPEGIAASISAAKNGAKVLLMERHDALGGLMTYGMLNSLDMSYGPNGTYFTHGTFSTFFNDIGQRTSFDVNKAKSVFMAMVKKYPNIHLELNTDFIKPIMDGNKIIGITAKRDGKNISYYGDRIIDATQNADVAASSGVPYTIGAEDINVKGNMQSASLIFGLKGLDWNNLKKIIAIDKKIPNTYIDDTSAWGFWTIVKKYKPSNPMLKLRGLNLGKQDDGSVLVNALLIFGVNGLDQKSIQKGINEAKKEMPRLISFFRKNIPGFENVQFDGVAPELYIRETRHIEGLYRLGINDVVFNRCFSDMIAIGSYPVDIQATSPNNDYGYVYGAPKEYSIPFRCIVPKKVDNLLVVGRSASYSHLAAGSARTIPIGMALGDAAGVASVYSIKHGKSFKAIAYDMNDIKAIQAILVKDGAYLKPFKIENKAYKNWSYKGLKFVLQWGLFPSGNDPGYENNYRFDVPIDGYVFNYMLKNMIKRAVPSKVSYIKDVRIGDNTPLNVGDGMAILISYSGVNIKNNAESSDLIDFAREKGIISDEAYKHLKVSKYITWSQAYDMTYSLYNYLSKK